MKTLVTGSTGFLGSAIVRELLKDNRSVRVLVRKGADLSNIEGLDIEVSFGDLRDPESLRSALKGCLTLYHCAAFYSLWSQDKQLMFDINVGGTRNVLQAAQESNISKVIYTSTVGCIGLNPDSTPSNEDTPLNPSILCNDYKLSKFQAEQVALDFSKNGLPVVIVNPSTPVGPRDIKPTPTGKLIQDFLNRKMPAFLDTGLNLIHVDDCARGHLLAEKKGKVGERYILGNENMSLKEILDALGKISGLPAPTVKMPYFIAYTAGWFCEVVSRLTQTPPAVPLDGVKMAKYHMYFDASKAVRELGLPQRPVELALKEAVHWMRENNMVKTNQRSL